MAQVLEKNGFQSMESRGGWNTKIHPASMPSRASCALVMERVCEDDETRALAHDPDYRPVVPPKGNRRNPWDDDRVIYERCDEIERRFRRLEAFRRLFSRFDTLDHMFMAFVHLASSLEILESCSWEQASSGEGANQES
jgi:transposase